MTDVAVVGGLNLDLVIRVPRIPAVGETVHHGRLARYAGGKGANQAVAAARAGATVSMLGAVGDDDAGRGLLDGLRASGVDVTHVTRSQADATGAALIFVDAAGANAIAVAEGANLSARPHQAAAAVARLQPRAVIGQGEISAQVTAAAFQAAPPTALRVFNASPVDAHGGVDAAHVDVVVVNEIEAAQLAGQAIDPGGPGALADLLASRTRRGCVVTLGAQGLVARLDGQRCAQPAFAVQVVDTTGAGDAFCGVFTAALAAGRSAPDALRWGQAAGALAASRRGAQPSMPSANEIRGLLESGGGASR